MDELALELEQLDELQTGFLDYLDETIAIISSSMSSLLSSTTPEIDDILSALQSRDSSDRANVTVLAKRKRNRPRCLKKNDLTVNDGTGSVRLASTERRRINFQACFHGIEISSEPTSTKHGSSLPFQSENYTDKTAAPSQDAVARTYCNDLRIKFSCFEDIADEVTSLRNRFQRSSKSVQSCLAKFSSVVDAQGGVEVPSMIAQSVTLERPQISEAIVMHFHCSAVFDFAEKFHDASSLGTFLDKDNRLHDLQHLLSSFRDGNYVPAVQWARANREASALRSDYWTKSDGAVEDTSPSFSASSAFVPAEQIEITASGNVASISAEDSNNSDTNEAGICEDHKEELSTTSTASLSSSSSLEAVAPSVGPDLKTSAPLSTTQLEFCLRRLVYLQLLQNGRRNDAMQYARTALVYFLQSHLPEIQALMGCLVFSSDLAGSPYKRLISDTHVRRIERALCLVYMSVKGLRKESMLQSVVRCGASCLPTLMKASRVTSVWKDRSTDDTLPAEIEIGRDCQHHSIFTCPVSREEAAEGLNPPMILPCGHVLSKQSISRLPRGSPRFKCPYCPTEQLQSDCQPLCF